MIGNSTTAWGWPAKLLHWTGAILILLLLGHGWWMTHLAPRPDRFAHYAGHAGLGYDFLVLLMLRLLWRWTHAVPALPAGLQRWERVSAQAGHVSLYILMLGSTLTGWALAGTFRTPLNKDAFGLPIPSIYTSQDRAMHGLFEESHEILSYLLAALIIVHVAGALRHHFVKHNDVLRRMWVGARSNR
ncbi:MAG: cytochrome b/b6 domain-containing protein [Hyphomicrobiales bacterium]|nr:cytochrome b/b6 domain-containing protein [Alphaproteobacteria bacterium]